MRWCAGVRRSDRMTVSPEEQRETSRERFKAFARRHVLRYAMAARNRPAMSQPVPAVQHEGTQRAQAGAKPPAGDSVNRAEPRNQR